MPALRAQLADAQAALARADTARAAAAQAYDEATASFHDADGRRRVACTEAEGPFRRYALWTRGCSLRCPGCCNPGLFAPGDATTDFFLLLSNIPGFEADPKAPGDNAGFAVFGEMVAGRDVAEKIYALPVSATAGEGAMKGQMIEPAVKIVSARRVPAPAEAPKGCATGGS